MITRKIHHFFVSSRIPLVIAVLIYVFFRFFPSINEKGNFEQWGTMALQIGIAFSLLYLNRIFMSVRNRSLLAPFFYLIFVASHPLFFCTWMNGIVTFCLFLFFALLLSPFFQSYPQGNALNIALVLTLGSLIWQPLLLFFPLLWIGMFLFRCLNYRSFFATLIGFAVIYLFIFTGSICIDDQPDMFLSKLTDYQIIFQFHAFDGLNTQEYIIVGYLFFLFLLSGIYIFLSDVAEKARTITILSFLYIVAFVFFVMLLLQPQWKNEWAMLLCIPLSLLVSHLFTKHYQNFNAWLLLITIAFFIAMYFLHSALN